MNNFLQLASGVDVLPLLTAIHRQPELWDQNTLRTAHELSPHKSVSDIWLWFNEISDDVARVVDDIKTIPYPAWERLPQARPILFDLMRRVEGTQLGRVIITKLAPGKTIEPHVDEGAPATYYQRFHVALQNLPGSLFRIGNEQVCFTQGDVWHINNRAEHSVVNNSADDRIVLIADIRCA